MDIKKLLGYVVLFIVAYTLWTQWNKEQAQSAANTAPVATSASNLPQVAAQPIKQASSLPQVGKQATPALLKTSHSNEVVKGAINIKTDVLAVKINPEGGGIIESKLLKYNQSLKNKKPFLLMNTNDSSYFVSQQGFVQAQQQDQAQFRTAQHNYVLQKGKNTLDVILTAHRGDLLLTKHYVFTRGSYAVKVTSTAKNEGSSTWSGHYFSQLTRANDAALHKSLFHLSFFGVALSSPKEPYKKISFESLNETPINQSIKDGWVAMVQHYFVTAWVPSDKQQAMEYYSNHQGNRYTAGMLSPELNLAPNQSASYGLTLYSGPAIAKDLTAVSPHLKLAIDYGWLWFISEFLFSIMKWIYALVGNWGLTIVLITVLIKAAFFWLSQKSYSSMAEMKRLQPKLEALKERFGEDRQKLGQATMKLYKEEKINPLGGCLPMLIQIPVFIGLYWVLVESVELRQAPFIFWIHDLSAKDPYFILPVLMGLSMFLQQRLSPAPMDPVQQKVMMMLPIVFTLLFANFPSGLVLYWLVNNLISIAQQWMVFRSYAKKDKAKKRKK